MNYNFKSLGNEFQFLVKHVKPQQLWLVLVIENQKETAVQIHLTKERQKLYHKTES